MEAKFNFEFFFLFLFYFYSFDYTIAELSECRRGEFFTLSDSISFMKSFILENLDNGPFCTSKLMVVDLGAMFL